MKLLQHEPSPVCGKSSVKKGLRAYAAAAPFVLPGLLLVLAFVFLLLQKLYMILLIYVLVFYNKKSPPSHKRDEEL